MGPTASGKTNLAMQLFDHLDAELISVDSALVYKGLDIGSAKPTPQELERYPHHLIDIRDPANPYSAVDFQEDALRLIAEITARGKMPILVGGTMLYFKILAQGVAALPSADPAVRDKIAALAATQGWEAVHEALKKVDPVSAQRIHPNDPQRLQRALEVYEITGKSLTEHWALQKQNNALALSGEQKAIYSPPIDQPFPSLAKDYNVIQIALTPNERSTLHKRIAIRFEDMVAKGFLDEVKILYQRADLHINLPAIKSVGYRQAWLHLQGEYDHGEMVEKGIIATRQLAKRQLTWLRGWPALNWIDSEAPDPLAQALILLKASNVVV